MVIQPAVKKETVRIAWGTLACFALVCGVALMTRTFDYTIVLGGLLGGACAIVCFLLLGLTVQHIVEEGTADQKRGKKRMRSSYLLRLLLMTAVFIVAVEASVFNWIAVAVMLLAPRAVVMLVPVIEHFKKKKQDKTQETL